MTPDFDTHSLDPFLTTDVGADALCIAPATMSVPNKPNLKQPN